MFYFCLSKGKHYLLARSETEYESGVCQCWTAHAFYSFSKNHNVTRVRVADDQERSYSTLFDNDLE
jgi:hypothetical protein